MPISPNQGSISGGTSVTITGVNLSNATSVKFGDHDATITANTPTMVSVTSPAGTGVCNVKVTTPGGVSNYLPFYYIESPIETSISQNSGSVAGGELVHILGYNLATATSVTFGANATTPTVISDGDISVVVPAGDPGSVNVTVTTGGGTCTSLIYTYVSSPTVDSISPSSGPSVGGTSITIVGTNFVTTTSVTIDGVAAAFGVLNSSTLSVITPPGSSGSVDVVVTTTAGSATAASGYTYINGPGI